MLEQRLFFFFGNFFAVFLMSFQSIALWNFLKIIKKFGKIIIQSHVQLAFNSFLALIYGHKNLNSETQSITK